MQCESMSGSMSGSMCCLINVWCVLTCSSTMGGQLVNLSHRTISHLRSGEQPSMLASYTIITSVIPHPLSGWIYITREISRPLSRKICITHVISCLFSGQIFVRNNPTELSSLTTLIGPMPDLTIRVPKQNSTVQVLEWKEQRRL